MKLVTFQPKSQPDARIGALVGERIVDLNAADPCLPRGMPGFIALGADGLKTAAHAIDSAIAMRSSSQGLKPIWSREDVTLLAPVPRPGKILCSGLNYRSHVEENPNAKFLEDPRFFAKLPNTVIGPGAAIRHPGERYQVDYEVELAIVIGRPMPRGTPAERVMEHVFGYTILHDVSARYIQFKDNNEMMGKNFDTFCPLGPCLVTTDEIRHPEKLRLRLLLNGRIMQDGTNTDWCFPLPRLLAWLSQAMTLDGGDIVSTGTPAGIGWFRKPQVFLQPGDLCRLEIEEIGALENPVVNCGLQIADCGLPN